MKGRMLKIATLVVIVVFCGLIGGCRMVMKELNFGIGELETEISK